MSSVSYEKLEFLFHPHSIALVGITTANPDHWTRTFLDSLLEFNFEGPLYLVNPKGGEIAGMKVYPRLEDVPSSIDYVISTVPARATPGLIEESARKGVKAIHCCAAGFGETGEEEGIRLEAELKEAGQRTGIRIIGPNCMGIYCPKSRLSFQSSFPRDGGPVALISQSGGNTTNLINKAMLRGVRFSKVISYGNATDLNESDYIEYLTDDPETSIISLYLEGVKDGERFRRVVRRAAEKKAVLLLKGGVTEAGARATSGHTGSLAGSESTWDSLCKQAGIIRASTLEELVNALVTLLFMPAPRGRRAAIIGFGGGASVLITDIFEKNGLKVPALPQELRDEIRSYTPIAGNILRNPIDYSQSVQSIQNLTRTLGIVSKWDGIDFIVSFITPSQASPGSRRLMINIVEGMLEGSRAGAKPIAMVIEPSVIPHEAEDVMGLIQLCVSDGMPVYFSYSDAASAMNLILTFAENHPGKLYG